MPATYLLFLSIFFGLILASSTTSADEVVDEIGVNVPISCSLSGVGMDSHTTSLMNGNYASDVGTTTLKALCNDNEGFAIYAIGYTDDTDGKTVMSSSTLGDEYDIVTGTGTSGNSQWAMKLSTQTSPEPTYPISIVNNYNQYHVVPDDYELVAKRTSATDVGATAIGSTLTSTYQIYVSTTQPADTYVGQVKYILVHPNYVDSDMLKDAVTVVFDGDGLTFPDGTTTNTVKYANVCKPGGSGYVGSTYQEVMTSNINSGGQSGGAYASDESIIQPVTINGADKLKVVVSYGFSNAEGVIIEGTWNGGSEPDNYQWLYDYENDEKTFVFDGDTITVYFGSWGTPDENYNYGMYVKVYPVYNTEQPGTTYEDFPSSDCFVTSISGNYTETTTWRGKWIAEIPHEYCYWDDDLQENVCETEINTTELSNENDLINQIWGNYNSMKGTTIILSAYNPYYLSYNGNGASNEIGMDIQQHYYNAYDWGESGWENQTLSVGDRVTLLAPNYKRAGYGFIGWSTDPNAASHISSATLYGPNETIIVNQDVLDTASNDHIVTLYATWLPSAGNLQNWSGCSNMGVGDATALTDTRDNNTYAVAKLSDGNCWMIENLRLGGDSPITLTTSNTQSAGVLPANSNNGWQQSSEQRVATINTSSPEAVVNNIHQKNYSHGNYYSWFAAINSANPVYDQENNTSICPASWKLPSGSDFSGLVNSIQGESSAETSNNVRSYPNNYSFAGFVIDSKNVVDFDNYERNYNGRIIIGNPQGMYWANEAHSGYYANYHYRIELYESSVYVTSGNASSDHGVTGNPFEGYTIRCLLSN